MLYRGGGLEYTVFKVRLKHVFYKYKVNKRVRDLKTGGVSLLDKGELYPALPRKHMVYPAFLVAAL